MKTNDEDVSINLPHIGNANPLFRCGEPVTIDGYEYQTVIIGEKKTMQTWFAENLQTTHYSDGTEIKNAIEPKGWEDKNKEGRCCSYKFDDIHAKTYGRLYNWYAIKNNRICPDGWHVPTMLDWMTLVSIVGGMGDKLKAPVDWKVPPQEENKECAYSALPGGACESDGNFKLLGDLGVWWSDTMVGKQNALSFHLYNGSPCTNLFPSGLNYGFSVRLIKNKTET